MMNYLLVMVNIIGITEFTNKNTVRPLVRKNNN